MQGKSHYKLFPLNIILDSVKATQSQIGYMQYYQVDQAVCQEYLTFMSEIIQTVSHYQIPVITLDKETPKEAVCQVFENVNQGGVSLTVFELVTAVFAMDNFELRPDWENRKYNHLNGEVLNIVTATDFLTACTLLAAYDKGGTVSCKKKDVLNLQLADYQKYADILTQGFEEAENLLAEERIFVSRDLPYTTQLIPLAVLCALLLPDHRIKQSNVKTKIKQWYWCGVFGELYGSAPTKPAMSTQAIGLIWMIALPIILSNSSSTGRRKSLMPFLVPRVSRFPAETVTR